MKNVFKLILSAHIAAFGIQFAADTAEAQVLRPGDDAVITRDGRIIVNPPLQNPRPTAPSTRNPDGSTTYPRGTTPARTDGFTQVNRDGSVTIYPRESAPLRDQPDAPEGSDLRVPYRFSDGLQLRARYNYQPESGAEDESPTEPPTIKFLHDAESPPTESEIPESGEDDGGVMLRYNFRDRFGGGMTRVDPPTLILDDDIEPPVESVIPELQGGTPSTSESETGNQADTPERLELSFPYRFRDGFQLRARYNDLPESGAEDDSPIEPPTIEFLDDAESPPIESMIPESGEDDGEVILRYYFRDRLGGGMTRVDPPTLILDDDIEPPVESVIPELQGGTPSTSESETGDQADALEGLDLSLPYRFSDGLQLRARYNDQPESGAEDDSPTEPPTIEFLDDAESPVIESLFPEQQESPSDPNESSSSDYQQRGLGDTISTIVYDGGLGEPAPASQKSWDEVWAEFFGRKIPDPLSPEETEEYQNNKEEFDKRTQAAAEFTQAATSVVTAGVPGPSTASTAGSVAVSEAVDAVVDGETSEEPGILGQVWNGITSAAGWVGSLFD